MGSETLKGSCLCGAVTWTFEGMPESATVCNCTACRRYGALWIYDFEGERVAIAGPTTAYVRHDLDEPPYLENRFCVTCGCLVCWRGLAAQEDGRRRMAVNLRLSEPGPTAQVPIRWFDGLVAFTDLPGDGRCVRDVWFTTGRG